MTAPRLIALVAPLAVVALGCGSPRSAVGTESQGPAPPLPTAGMGDLTQVQAQQAVQMYVNKCARCHKFYDPRAYSDPDWQRWMHKMSDKAKLQPAESDLLTRYFDAFRALEPAPAVK